MERWDEGEVTDSERVTEDRGGRREDQEARNSLEGCKGSSRLSI